ncbi:MAG: hydroxymethylglutaryl-CoA lyase [Thermodesulfobacteriota bacterium]
MEPVTVVEVGPRDGLQYESAFFPTDKKIALIELLGSAGLKRLEISSFVHPKFIPQFQDVLEVIQGVAGKGGVLYSALVPNVKGCEKAVQTGIDQLALFLSASETHNRKNVNMSVAESLAALTAVARLGREAGKSLRGYIVTAFGCPYEGIVPLTRVLDLIKAYQDMGVVEISLGDTTGMANPSQVARVMAAAIEAAAPLAVAGHFHNSRGTALVNVLAAYQSGVRVFDSSVGGIGGCPTALGALGNVATEDLVNLFEEMGVPTGVDFDRLLAAARLAQEVIGRDLDSYTLKTGRPNWRGGPAGEAKRPA